MAAAACGLLAAIWASPDRPTSPIGRGTWYRSADARGNLWPRQRAMRPAVKIPH
ncbi:hypothetical protein PJI17_10870 [Mycobacterium kansasii]